MKRNRFDKNLIGTVLVIVLLAFCLAGCGVRTSVVDEEARASLIAAETEDPEEAIKAIYEKNSSRETSLSESPASPDQTPETSSHVDASDETDAKTPSREEEDTSKSSLKDRKKAEILASEEEQASEREEAKEIIASIEESVKESEESARSASEEESRAAASSEEAARQSEEEASRNEAESTAASETPAPEESAAPSESPVEETSTTVAEAPTETTPTETAAPETEPSTEAAPSETPPPETAPPAPQAYGKTVLVGDSRTAEFVNTGLLPASQCFFYPGAVFALRDPGFGQQAVNAANTHPAKAVFMNGMNDLGVYHGDAGIFIAEYQATIDTFLSISPGTQIYCNAIIPATPDATAQYPGRENVGGFNAAIQGMCASRGWTYIDANGGFQDAWYLADGVHFDWAWYPVWLGNFQAIVGGF